MLLEHLLLSKFTKSLFCKTSCLDNSKLLLKKLAQPHSLFGLEENQQLENFNYLIHWQSSVVGQRLKQFCEIGITIWQYPNL